MYPILFRIGSIEIRSYGVMIALAFIVGTILSVREARRKGFNPELIYDLVFYVMIASIIGSRLYFVLFSDPSYFISHPVEIFALWKGGLSLHGGLVGGLIVGIWFCKREGITFWSLADTVTPSIILGQAIGRVGCTLNGCSYGRPADLPWAIIFTDPNALAPLNKPLHPTQLYEFSLDMLLFVVLLALRKKIKFDGQLFLCYVFGYAAIRFFVENFRGDQLRIMGLFPVAQVMSVTIFIAAMATYFLLKKRQS